MNLTQLLAEIHTTHEEWEALLAQADYSRYNAPGVCGSWSLKDLVAHIAWFENEITQMVQARSYKNASSWWMLPQDERNAQIHVLYQNMPLEDVLALAKAAHQEVLATLATLSDEDLNDAARFAESPPGFLPWQIIAQNTFEHYQFHSNDLRR